MKKINSKNFDKKNDESLKNVDISNLIAFDYYHDNYNTKSFTKNIEQYTHFIKDSLGKVAESIKDHELNEKITRIAIGRIFFLIVSLVSVP